MARRWIAIAFLLALLAGVYLASGESPGANWAQDKAGPELAARLAGHADAVFALAFSPDGKYVATASFDSTLKLWDAATGKQIKTYGGAVGHTKQVISLAFSQDGTMLASGSTDNTIKVWDVPVNVPIRSLKNNDAVSAVALSPDGTKLALAGNDGSLRLVTAVEFKELGKFESGHQGAVSGLAFNANGQTLASVGADRTLRYWNTANGKLIATVGAHTAGVNSVAVNPGAAVAYTVGGDGMLKFWSLPALASKTLPGHAARIRAMALAPDNASYYTGSDDKTVKQFAIATAKEARALTGPVAGIVSVATHPQNAIIAAGTQDGKIFLWNNADAKAPTSWLAHAGQVTSVQVNAQGTQLLSAGADGLVKLWALPAKTPPKMVASLPAHPAGPTFAQYHANGQQLISAGADKTVKLWDLAKASVLKSFGPVADPIKAIAFSKDFTKIGVATGKTVKVFVVADGKEAASLNHPTDVLSLSFSPDGTRIATGAADKQTRIWDVAAGIELQFFTQDDAVNAVIYAPANNLVISAAGKMTRLDTTSILRAIKADTGPTHALALAPANTHVLTGGADKIAKLWNVNTGALDRSFAGAGGAVRAVAISKNGQLVAAGGADQTVRIYQFADAKELGAVKTPGEIRALGFTPNSLALVGATAGKTLDAWSTPFTPGQPLPKDFLTPVQSFTSADLAGFAIAADNASIYSAGQDRAMHVWKLASPAPTRNFNYGVNVDAVAFQPNSTTLAAAGHDGKIRLFDLVKNAQVKDIPAHIREMNKQQVPQPIYSLTFSADGKQLLSASYDGSLKLWDPASGTLIKEFKAHKAKDFERGHQEPVYAAALSPDGKFIASGSSGLERTIKIWSIDGTVVRDLANPNFKTAPGFPPQSHPGGITGLRFTKDGKYLISAGDAPGNKGFLAIWDWQTGKMLYDNTALNGVYYGLALSPDEKLIAVSAGNRDRKSASPDFNAAYLFKMPALGK